MKGRKIFFLNAKMKISLTGTARIVDATGELVKEVNLADIGEVEAERVDAYPMYGDQTANLDITIKNLFGTPEVED